MTDLQRRQTCQTAKHVIGQTSKRVAAQRPTRASARQYKRLSTIPLLKPRSRSTNSVCRLVRSDMVALSSSAKFMSFKYLGMSQGLRSQTSIVTPQHQTTYSVVSCPTSANNPVGSTLMGLPCKSLLPTRLSRVHMCWQLQSKHVQCIKAGQAVKLIHVNGKQSHVL
jgi:hypothetical protein